MTQERGNESLMANHERYFLNPETMQEANLIRILQEGDPVELPPALLIQGTADVGVPQGETSSWLCSRVCRTASRVGRTQTWPR